MPEAEGRKMPERCRPLRIWRSLDPERKLRAAAAFWKSDLVKPPEIELAVTSLATALHFRPQSIRTAPLARRAAWLAGYHGISDHLAAPILYAYHLTHQVPMMVRFLDSIGVEHEEGRIKEEAKSPEPKAVEEGVDALLKEFDRKDVITYLETLVSQDEKTWAGVAAVLEARLST